MTSSTKNLWIINQYAGSSKHGMTFRSFYLAKEFIKKYNVEIISASYSHVMNKPPEVHEKFTKEEVEGVSFNWVKVPRYKKSKSIGRILSMFLFLFELFLINTKHLKKPDVIIVSSISPFPIWKAYLWAKRFNAKLIFEVRDIWPLSVIELGGFSKYNPFVMLLQLTENFAYKYSDYVVSVLPLAFDHMKYHGLKKEKFIYIPNGVEIKESIGLTNTNSETFKVGYSGTLGIANALMFLVKAAELTQPLNIEFHILGDGPEKKNLQEIVLSKGLSNVIFHDAVPKEEVQAFLSKMDILYIGWHLSSLYRFGISANKLFDYMMSAKPIVHSVSAGNDPVKEAKAGISIEPENATLIADAIIEIYNLSSEERTILGKNGRKYVEENHSYQQLAKQYESLFY
ncbi:MAG: glycosyltransferase family 4 protein [Flavobacteriales bacterium]